MSALLHRAGWWNAAAWWKRSLAGQFITMLLLGLIAAQALTMLISWDDHTKAYKQMAKAEFIGRTATLARLVETMPDALRTDVLAAGGTGFTRFWTTQEEPVDISAFKAQALGQLEAPLPGIAAMETTVYPHRQSEAEMNAALTRMLEPMRNGPAAEEWAAVNPEAIRSLRVGQAKYVQLSPDYSIGIAVPLSDGTWLNSVYFKSYDSPFWNTQTLSSIGLTAVLLSALGIVTARRTTKPLRELAHAAEALGRGETTKRLPECGPDDIRSTCAAFNRMQERLTRFVADRTRMLAAISHDLRTPLTSLRLRAEYIEDEALKGKVLDTIAEMQAMTEATLSFAKEEAGVENTRTVELCSVVESLCDDMVELGQDVTFSGDKVAYRCRPDALRRALRNLIENAVRYGGHARVTLRRTPGGVEIAVADGGPGIPEAMREQVFSPFFRLESSRNRQTGGVGLGLAIVRAIVRQHGGDVTLSSNDPGLVATVLLPEQAQSEARTAGIRRGLRLRPVGVGDKRPLGADA